MAKKKVHSPLGAVLNIIGTAIIIAAIVLCLMLTVPRLAGYSGYCVLTGSMEPSIPVGSLIYAKAVDPASLNADDVIVFSDGRSDVPITHRVVSNDPENGEIITKGDANANADLSPVSYYDVYGRVALHIPVLGRLLIPLGTLTGKLGVIAIIIAGLLLCELARRLD
ncbi:MAG: signal peptidase I [Firmicutes bacterium]|nr:signal peptidase I [Bacillota bacterium]